MLKLSIHEKSFKNVSHFPYSKGYIFGERVFRNLWSLTSFITIENIFKKNFFYINIIKFEHISSFFFYHWNFPRKIIGSTSWMMMKFGSADVLLIFKYLLKSLTPRSTKIPLSLMCCFRNLSVLLFQVAGAELWKAVQALIYLSGLPSALPPSFRS